MVLSDEKAREYTRRLLLSRMRILINNGFYGLLLMSMIFSLDKSVETAATDGKRIYFAPEFLEALSDAELDFVMMHEILHVALKHIFRGKNFDQQIFNQACDIVVNSNILKSKNNDVSFITLTKFGTAMHQTPNGEEGFKYTAEEVYAMFNRSKTNLDDDGHLPSAKSKKNGSPRKNPKNDAKDTPKEAPKDSFDYHGRWGTVDDDLLEDVWNKKIADACEALLIRDPSNSRGTLPLFAERLYKELTKPQTDWRTILNEFVQEEITDYSFTPPDRRFGDCPFFLPDFNEKDDTVEDVLFMIDTSGSMSDDMITAAYSEIKGALEQFNGKLKGWLGFFDAAVVEPKPFGGESELEIIKPKGGGGTSFGVIFNYIFREMTDKLPVCIVILTDGFAPFPSEKEARSLPVLWLLNNEDITPPWGKTARIVID